MPLAAGARLGPYVIVSQIGAGGMGEVYRATDTKLKRQVALKILPPAPAADLDRLARFQREAEVLASLNHPHIAAIYGIEESQDVRAIVMELVEGEDLAQRVARGAIPLDEALLIARQIAEALEAAHEQGIVHRDLKPANIKLRPDGTVKVLDFGLAKALGREPETAPHLTRSPTITSPAMMTAVGMIIGTAAYMSPEQARGKTADKRSDVWAFGCVLYEMLTGRRAFEGDEVSDTLAAVLRGEPDWNALPPGTPVQVRTLLRRCLTKDRTRRLDSAAAARLEIDDALMPAAADATIHAAPPPRAGFFRKAIAAGAVVLIGLAAGYGGWTLRPEAPRAVTRFALTLGDVFFGNPSFHMVALSPDGRRLVYAVNTGLYLRAFDKLDAAPIAGLEGGTLARSPFFSPDGQWVGFYQDGQLKKVSINGGAPVTICTIQSAPFGVSWAADNTILIGQGSGGIWRVSGDGGTPEPIVMIDAGQRAHGPQLLPDGRSVLFTLARNSSWDEAEIVVQSLESGTRKTLITGGTDARYVATGHLVYALRGTVLGVPFDPASVSIRGGPVPLVEGVRHETGFAGAAQFAVSSDGTFAYLPEGSLAVSPRTLAWADRQGREEAIAAPPRPYVYPRLAPDGTRLALDIVDPNRDIWVWDFPRGTLTRLTSDPTIDRQPIWTPNGQAIIFSSDRTGVANLFRQAANGTGTAEQLTDSRNPTYAHTMSPDGRQVVMRQTQEGSDPSLTILDIGDGRGASSPASRSATPKALVDTLFSEFNAEISPDGRWLAYQSNASGDFEVYVRPFPDVASGQWQVSTSGGTEPLWARNGRELFYRAPKGAVIGVSIAAGPTWTAGTQAQIIGSSGYALGGAGDFTVHPYRTYDVSPDGQRFLMIKNSDAPSQAVPTARIVVVRNWTDELIALLPR